MPANLWRDFFDLLPANPRLLATVTSHNEDGTSSLTSLDGQSMRAWGRIEGAVPPYNVFLRDGKIEAAAPNLAMSELTV